MQRFKSPEQAHRFLSSHAMIYDHFRPRRHLMTALQYRRARDKAFRGWREETCVQIAARSCTPSCRTSLRAPCFNNLVMPD